jgi:hypothetical protein
MPASQPTSSSRPNPTATPRERFGRWVAEHDDSWLFTALYVGLALLLSTVISLFWLVVVVAAHGVLEWFSLSHRGVHDRRLGRVVWHLKLDVGLVLVALALGLYFEVLFGVAGLNAAARTGAQGAARFVAWQRTLRGVLLAADDAALVAKAVVARRSAGSADSPAAATVPAAAAPGTAAAATVAAEPLPWTRPWPLGDRVAVALTAAFAALVLLAPALTDHTVVTAWATVVAELHPWPGG